MQILRSCVSPSGGLQPRRLHRAADVAQGRLHLVREQRLLIGLASAAGGSQLFHNAAIVVQILFATRMLVLHGQTVGLCYVDWQSLAGQTRTWGTSPSRGIELLQC